MAKNYLKNQQNLLIKQFTLNIINRKYKFCEFS